MRMGGIEHHEQEFLLEAGRCLRGRLAHLGAPGLDWQALDDELSAALNDANRTAAVARVRVLLEAHPETADWWVRYQRAGGPPDVSDPVRAVLLGRGEVVVAPRFACPEGDYTWYRRSPARPIPLCRTHQVRLVRSPPTP